MTHASLRVGPVRRQSPGVCALDGPAEGLVYLVLHLGDTPLRGRAAFPFKGVFPFNQDIVIAVDAAKLTAGLGDEFSLVTARALIVGA